MTSLLLGDCAQVLPRLQANAYDSLITDPPASINFMGQEWDGDRGGRREWCAWLTGIMREALRVLKPGAHGLVWAIPRRSHWTALALEDAGFEIRDCIHHYFLNGFPKNMSVDKAIDKKLRYERNVIETERCRNIKGVNGYAPGGEVKVFDYEYTAAASPGAKEWDGWGTHMKPAIEHWWLVRKPLSEKTVAENVLKWGTGALNIDASRIPVAIEKDNSTAQGTFVGRPKRPVPKVPMQNWVEGFPGWHDTKTPFPEGNATLPGYFSKDQQGKPRPADSHPDNRYPSHFIVSDWELLEDHTGFFHPPIYCPKARRCKGEGNHHPMVKPVELMMYFITLLTRPRGHVLDCFAGSFTTGVATQQLGFRFTGIELDPAYVKIGIRRLGGAA